MKTPHVRGFLSNGILLIYAEIGTIVLMKLVATSPWTAALLVITGVIVGYTFFLSENRIMVSAAQHCPFRETCAKGECDTESSCANEQCAGCPFCNRKKTT